MFAEDFDGTDVNSRFQFFIIDGAFDKFAIDISTGRLSVQINTKLDRESQDLYNITIMAIDQGSPPLTGSTIFEITLLDTNDEFPKFRQSSYAVRIHENRSESVGLEMTAVGATDPDDDSDLFYSIHDVSGVDEVGQNASHALIQVHSCYAK